jgi:hypothetical protein
MGSPWGGSPNSPYFRQISLARQAVSGTIQPIITLIRGLGRERGNIDSNLKVGYFNPNLFAALRLPSKSSVRRLREPQIL